VVDDSGFPKDGKASSVGSPPVLGHVGQDRQLSDRVSVQMVTDQASVAANWRLFLARPRGMRTRSTTEVAGSVRARRARAGSDEVRHREKWRLALDMLDQMLTPAPRWVCRWWGLPKRPVVGDSGYGDATEFGWDSLNASWSTSCRSIRPHRPPGDAAPATPPSTGRAARPKPR